MEQINHILREYDLFPQSSKRVKSVWKIDTARGVFALKHIRAKKEQLQFISEALYYLYNSDFPSVLPFISTKYGEPFVPFKDGFAYVTPWIEGKTGEELLKSREWIPSVFEALGKMHQLGITEQQDAIPYLTKTGSDLMEEWQSRMYTLIEYKEAARERIYPSPVDFVFMENVDTIMEMTEHAIYRLENWLENIKEKEKVRLTFSHGRLSPFHIIMAKQPVFINFDKAQLDLVPRDLSYFVRIVTTKLRSTPAELEEWLKIYQKENPISPEEEEIFNISLLYPGNLLDFIDQYYRKLANNRYTEIVLVRHFEKLMDEQHLILGA